MPEQIAELLGLPSVTFAKKVAVEGGAVKVQRQTEAGYDEVTCSLPALISVTAGVVEPRYPSFKGIMAAKSKPIDEVKAADLGIQIMGGMGYSTETDMQRYWRDHRILRMTPISNEMVRNSIAESLGLPRSY